jgi:hypothetical protein
MSCLLRESAVYAQCDATNTKFIQLAVVNTRFALDRDDCRRRLERPAVRLLMRFVSEWIGFTTPETSTIAADNDTDTFCHTRVLCAL